ncbi:MAG: DUF3169 family protein [Velocimicrobium sp.]
MNETVKNNINREDNKAKKKFSIIIIFSLVFGFIIGIILSLVSKNFIGTTPIHKERLNETFLQLGHTIQLMMPYIFLLFSSIWAILMIYIYRSARKEFDCLELEDEIILKTIEKKISIALMLTTIYYIISYALLGVIFTGIYNNFKIGLHGYLLSLLVFIANIIIYVQMQRKLINLTKEMNPEKRGSVYDMKFRKEWLSSCDEAEQTIIYKSAYKSFVVMSHLFLLLMVLFFLISMLFSVGLFPLILSASLWIIMTLIYHLECMNLSK